MQIVVVACATLLLLTVLVSRGVHDTETLDLTPSDGVIDLTDQLPGDWERVCILTPYITFIQASKLLGFFYFPELTGSIAVMDDRTQLVTARGNKVAGVYEVMLNNADFTQTSSGCYPRQKSVFTYQPAEKTQGVRVLTFQPTPHKLKTTKGKRSDPLIMIQADNKERPSIVKATACFRC